MDFKTSASIEASAGLCAREAGLPIKRMLVVDDVPEICDLFAQVVRRLRGVNVELVTEVNSLRALEMLNQERFDLVVSDFRMREVDGVEILSTARRTFPGGNRILITGYNEIPASIDRIRQAAVDGYLQKPMNVQDLLILLFDVLNGDPRCLASLRERARELEQLAFAEEAARLT